MSLASIVQYATLFSLLIGVLGLGIALLIHRQQVTTQIFLALSARYDELLQSSSAGVWIGRRLETSLPEPSNELTISVLRYCSHVSFCYFLFQRRSIPSRMWKLMLPSVMRTLCSPLFVREWKIVRSEFEAFPDFVALVLSIQEGKPSSTRR